MKYFEKISNLYVEHKKYNTGVSYRELMRGKGENRLRRAKRNNDIDKVVSNFETITKIKSSGNTYTQYHIKVGTKAKPAGSSSIIRIVKKFIENKNINDKVRVVLKYTDTSNKPSLWSTHFEDANKIVKALKDKSREIDNKYDADMIAEEIIIETSKIGAVNIIGRGGDAKIETYEDWNILGNKTKTNCLYHAFVISEYGGIPETITNLAKNMKKRVKPINKDGSQYEDIEKLAKYKKRNIILHDGKKEIMKVFEGCPKESRTDKRADIHIVYDNNHFSGMFKGKPIIEKAVFDKHTVSGPIRKRFKDNNKKKNFMTWDIEASPDKNNHFKSYAVGFYDGKEYFDAWGLDCLQKFEEHLYNKRNEYDGKVLYAHNSGKFDILLLMSEVILNSKKFEIDTTGMGCLELNGRWLNVTLKTSDGKTIHFRDSCALLPGKLDDLTKDFKVKHQKLQETVDHDKITLKNWHTWKELPKYLKHDVLGLYECLEQFSEDVWEATSMNINSKEKFCRDVIEELTDRKFVKARPQWLVLNGKRLEIDIFNEQLKIALEYNGEQHYKLCLLNKYDKEILAEQKKHDEFKEAICKDRGLTFIKIQYWLTKKQIVEKIKKETNIDKEIDFDNLGSRSTGINITECLTGASLSKKFFFMKYYDQFKMPVWTLDDEADAFIRKGYFGGRVEIFNFSEVNHDRFYYYDFTSLFPAMALKNLPYGQPEKRNKEYIERNIDNFFGFIRCKVTSKESKLKPLHAVYDDGKLKFMKLYQRELTLFSEELKLGKKLEQYEYEIIDGIEFKKGKIMERMSRDVFSFKAKAKSEGKDALSLVWKIILNSSYGFWGLRTHNRDAVKVFKKGQAPVQAYLNSGKLKDEVDIGNYTFLNVLNDLEVTDFNVGIASAITSYARCELWSLIRDIQIRKGKVFMCDTDSIVCSIDLNDYPELKERYQWDGIGDELGTLKNELNDAVKKIFKKKDDEESKKIVEYCKNNNLYFDHCILNGAKYYSLKSDKYNVDISKCKGFKKTVDCKLKYESMKEDLKQNVKQFRAGYSSYMNPENPWKIELVNVEKTIKPQYSKGKIMKDGSIEPFEDKKTLRK